MPVIKHNTVNALLDEADIREFLAIWWIKGTSVNEWIRIFWTHIEEEVDRVYGNEKDDVKYMAEDVMHAVQWHIWKLQIKNRKSIEFDSVRTFMKGLQALYKDLTEKSGKFIDMWRYEPDESFTWEFEVDDSVE